MSGGADCNCDLCTTQRTGNYSAFADQAKRQHLSADAERAMRIAWKVQLSEDTRQRKLAMRADAKDRVAAAQAKRNKRFVKYAVQSHTSALGVIRERVMRKKWK